MKRSFVTLCIFLLVGIFIAHFLKITIQIQYVVLVLVISILMLIFYERAFIFFIYGLLILLGVYTYGQSMVGDTLMEYAPLNTQIEATVLSESEFKRGYKEYEIKIKYLSIDGHTQKVKVNKKGRLILYGINGEDIIPTLNDSINIFNMKLRKPFEGAKSNKENSYDFYLKSKGIEYIIEANAHEVSITKDRVNILVMLSNISNKMKIHVEDFLDSTLNFNNSNILKSIVFGNQGYLSKDELSIFSKTGTAHIMAVSGLHVGLLVLIVDKFLKTLKVGKNKRICMTIIFLFIYSYMVFFPVSIVRAGIMYFLFVLAYFLQRRYDSINALFLIAFIVLIIRPMTIFSISFQLSFTATLSILVIGPKLNRVLKKPIGILAPLLSVTLAAQIGTLPLMVYHFKQISLISFVTNILIVPILTPMLSIVFFSIFIGLISFELGALINRITDQLLTYVYWVSLKSSNIPYASIEISELKITYVILYYIILITVSHFLSFKKEPNTLGKEGSLNKYEL